MLHLATLLIDKNNTKHKTKTQVRNLNNIIYVKTHSEILKSGKSLQLNQQRKLFRTPKRASNGICIHAYVHVHFTYFMHKKCI